MSRLYILYDGRANPSDGTDDASVLVTARSYEEAKKDASMFGDSWCWSYRDDDPNSQYLTDERVEFGYDGKGNFFFEANYND
jgi:hypothetical protein